MKTFIVTITFIILKPDVFQYNVLKVLLIKGLQVTTHSKVHDTSDAKHYHFSITDLFDLHGKHNKEGVFPLLLSST